MRRATWWMCNRCDHVLKADTPPEKCPQCKRISLFSDITRYVPENAPRYSRVIYEEFEGVK